MNDFLNKLIDYSNLEWSVKSDLSYLVAHWKEDVFDISFDLKFSSSSSGITSTPSLYNF